MDKLTMLEDQNKMLMQEIDEKTKKIRHLLLKLEWIEKPIRPYITAADIATILETDRFDFIQLSEDSIILKIDRVVSGSDVTLRISGKCAFFRDDLKEDEVILWDEFGGQKVNIRG